MASSSSSSSSAAEAARPSELLLTRQTNESLHLVLSHPRADVAVIKVADSPELDVLSGLDLRGWHRLTTLSVTDSRVAVFDVRLPEDLEELHLRSNALEAIPACVFEVSGLRTLNLAGNKLTTLAGPFEQLPRLSALYLGGNRITTIEPSVFQCMPSLGALYLGGNQLASLPDTVGDLQSLRALWLHDNQLTSVPSTICRLHTLESLHLHRNQLNVLPAEVLALRQLRSLSVRENPFVTRFADSYRPSPPTLVELAARVATKCRMPMPAGALPRPVERMISSARCCHACNNPVFGESFSRVEFLDLCGAYHVPFQQFICDPNCREHKRAGALDPVSRAAMIRKVLLDRYNPSLSAPVERLRDELAHSAWDEEFD